MPLATVPKLVPSTTAPLWVTAKLPPLNSFPAIVIPVTEMFSVMPPAVFAVATSTDPDAKLAEIVAGAACFKLLTQCCLPLCGSMLHKYRLNSCRESIVVAGPHEHTDTTYF